MKIYNHIIIVFILAFLFFNCKPEIGSEEGNLVIDSNVCIQITDTTGFNLYYFTPFTEHEWKYESYDYKLQRRQLPENVLELLTLEELFNHCIWWEMAGSMLLFNSSQKGFRGFYDDFNGVRELYKREGVHLFLEEKLRNIDKKDIIESKCWLYNHILEFMYVQEECLTLYQDGEVLNVLGFMFEKVERLAYLTTLELDSYKWIDLGQWMIGIGNILIMYDYEPFIDELENDLELKSFMQGSFNATENVVGKISEFGTEFYNNIKN
jgi:hypothetical protein